MIQTSCVNYRRDGSINTCSLQGFGNCSCPKNCPDYINESEMIKLVSKMLQQNDTEALVNDSQGFN